jgi:protein-tyrosine phosphatase
MDPEREAEPSPVLQRPGILVEHLPIGGIVAETRAMGWRVREGKIAEVRAETMAAVYEELLDGHPRTFGAVVARASEPASLPMVVHCTAGKDRTGIAAALILAALGVDEEAILDD